MKINSILNLNNSYKPVNCVFLMAKTLTKKESEDYNKLELITENLINLEKDFLDNPNNKNINDFSKKLKEYEEKGKDYLNQESKEYLEKRKDGIKDYLNGIVDTKYLRIFWDNDLL